MRSIQKLLGLREQQSDEADTRTVQRIAAELDRLPREQARYLAAFAYVLARVAHADLEIAPAELERIEALVAREGHLGSAQAALVSVLAQQHAVHFGGTENYLVTRQFRELAEHAQCIDLVRCLYHVAAAHDSISAQEDAAIRQIANELRLTPAEVSAIRWQFRAQLAELQPEP
jgi:uncharacterized tellurite resistance protein B-like protein